MIADIVGWRRPRLGECSLAAAQQGNPDSLTHISSTISSAPSSSPSSSSSTSSLSSRSDSSSSLSHLPASLSSDSSDNTNANISVASISVEVLTNDNALEYYDSPTHRSARGGGGGGSSSSSYAPNQATSPSMAHSGRQRRKLRECIPLISK